MLILYTDGGCNNTTDKFGAYAFVCVQMEHGSNFASANKVGKMLYGVSKSAENTTNNRMELLAVSKGMEESNRRELQIDLVVTDSEYVKKGIMEWSENWRRNKWRKSDGSPLANGEIWRELLDIHITIKTRVVHVRGHNGVYWNEVCDKLCTAAMQERN